VAVSYLGRRSPSRINLAAGVATAAVATVTVVVAAVVVAAVLQLFI
jgi:hypothetical protein